MTQSNSSLQASFVKANQEQISLGIHVSPKNLQAQNFYEKYENGKKLLDKKFPDNKVARVRELEKRFLESKHNEATEILDGLLQGADERDIAILDQFVNATQIFITPLKNTIITSPKLLSFVDTESGVVTSQNGATITIDEANDIVKIIDTDGTSELANETLSLHKAVVFLQSNGELRFRIMKETTVIPADGSCPLKSYETIYEGN